MRFFATDLMNCKSKKSKYDCIPHNIFWCFLLYCKLHIVKKCIYFTNKYILVWGLLILFWLEFNLYLLRANNKFGLNVFYWSIFNIHDHPRNIPLCKKCILLKFKCYLLHRTCKLQKISYRYLREIQDEIQKGNFLQLRIVWLCRVLYLVWSQMWKP